MRRQAKVQTGGAAPGGPFERSGDRFSEVDAAFDDVKEYAHSHGCTLRLEGVGAGGVDYVSMTTTCHHRPLSTMTLEVMLHERLKLRVAWVAKLERVEPSSEAL